METIPDAIVEETWQEFVGLGGDRAVKEMRNMGENQPGLVDFIMEFTHDLDPDVRHLAMYMMFVLQRIFQKSSPKKIKKISVEELFTAFEANNELMASKRGSYDSFLERIASAQLPGQAYVTRFVVEKLVEPPEEVFPVQLSGGDMGLLFVLLKSVVDVLDQAA